MKPTILIGIGAVVMIAGAAPQPAAAAETVPLPKFRQIELHGGGTVIVRHGPAQRVTVLNGSTRFTELKVTGRPRNERLVIDACNDRCPRQYRLEILVESPSAPDVGIWGGGSITVDQGFKAQDEISASVNGGGNIDLRAVPVSRASAAINGGGDIQLQASRTLSGVVNGGGLIRYWGNPSVSSAINGGGLIRRGE